MKRHNHPTSNQSATKPIRSPAPRPPSPAAGAFTLVELLVVISIIGILAGLITAAAIMARVAARNAAITMELKNLEMACQAYKNKFGEFPPDFAASPPSPFPDPTDGTTCDAQKIVLRHLARAFPRYQPGISTYNPATGSFTLTGWPGFLADVAADPVDGNPVSDVKGWGLDVANNVNLLSPASALIFWLGGKPDWIVRADGTPILPSDVDEFDPMKPVKGFLGFSADPTNPFNDSPSRIRPFFDFDLACLRFFNDAYNPSRWDPAHPEGLAIWPSMACDQGTSPVIYFRANNGTYFQEGTASVVKACSRVCPAVNTQLIPNTVPVHSAGWVNSVVNNPSWVNPRSFQIFSSGLDMTYGELWSPPGQIPPFPTDRLLFPDSGNYAPATYDDITNFSGGTLEDAMP